MTDPSETSAIQTHLKAVKQLIAACLERLKAEDAEAFKGAAVAMKNGASVRVTTGLSTAGMCEVGIDLVDVQGEALNLARVAFRTPSRN